MNVLDKKRSVDRYFFKQFFEIKKPKITYLLIQQGTKGINTSLKQNLDEVWMFGGFTKKRFNYLRLYISHKESIDYLWDIYIRLTKNKALIYDIQETDSI